MTTLAAVFLSIPLLSGTSGARPADATAPPPLLSVATPLGEDVFLLKGFRGEESISSLYSFRLDLVAPSDREIPFDAILGKDVRVTVMLPGGSTRHFSGICNRFTQGDPDVVARYAAEIVPRAWLLTQRRGSRIFQELSVPQILMEVLGGVPDLAFEMQLQGDFPPRDYVVQYRESDFDFASRLMEEEGIYYFFEHTAAGHTMVLANTPQGHPDLPGAFRYLRGAPGPVQPGSILSWEKTQAIRAGKYTLWDHSFELPGRNLEAIDAIQESVAAGQVLHRLDLAVSDALEIYDYPGGYAKRFDGIGASGEERPEVLAQIAEEAQRTARLRMQEEAAGSLVIRGGSTAATFVPGHRFTLAGNVNADGPYVLTSVRHDARSSERSTRGDYRNSFTCIPAGLPFRPARTTPRPVIPGTQTAVVVGPPGEEVFTDKYGRVKVQFHWDRDGRSDASSSGWIRVGALNAGTEAGFTHIPRIGEEVVVSFLDGDPDQPIIVGSAYNPENPPPSPD
jgi:type VI secretion system secreted protein VgrG